LIFPPVRIKNKRISTPKKIRDGKEKGVFDGKDVVKMRDER
jgi:hypothetical protein